MITGKIIFDENKSCDIDAQLALQRDAQVNNFLGTLEKIHGVTILKISDALCDNDRCQTIIEGIPIYRDEGHLSYAGSKVVMSRLGIADHF